MGKSSVEIFRQSENQCELFKMLVSALKIISISIFCVGIIDILHIKLLCIPSNK